MDQILIQFKEFIAQYTIRQKLIMGLVILTILSSVIAMVMWANRTEYDLLYSGLDAGSAGAIVEDLRGSKIKYRLENGGTSVYVPKDQVAELRLKYVQSGYLKDAVSGYELFEENNLGMTTFMQRLNLKRALEGELMRTINQFPEVKMSRIHLVMPENRLFEDENNTSASVVLHLQSGARLKANQLNGIAALVANSVEGLNVQDVVVMDARGDVLIENNDEEKTLGKVGHQYELKIALEEKLQDKVKDIMESVVGHGNSVVKVSADLNFDQLERTIRDFDPERGVVISEDKSVENSQDLVDSSNFALENVTTNYEYTEKTEHFVSNSGEIERLTIAVLVNGRYKLNENPEGETSSEYVPRSVEEIEQITALVKTAVGFSEERGDVVQVQNMKFGYNTSQPKSDFTSDNFSWEMLKPLLTYLLIGIGLLMAYRLIKGMFNATVDQFAIAVPARGTAGALGKGGGSAGALPEAEPEVELPDDAFMKKLSPEARAKMKAKDKMTEAVLEFTEESPDNAAALLRSWLTQPAKQE
jgi:flagellar M-ring protein FliF